MSAARQNIQYIIARYNPEDLYINVIFGYFVQNLLYVEALSIIDITV